jgi:hemin uptake protein HemP
MEQSDDKQGSPAPRRRPTGALQQDIRQGSPVVTSEALLAGRQELVIHHGGDCYRLRVTSRNKLILTK